jgi:hypothetical protein
MKLYRVITENKNYQDIIAYLMEHKLDATIIQANGLWQGRAEKSIVIELAECTEAKWQNPMCNEVEKLVYFIKKNNKQDKVMLQEINAELWLL